MRVFREGYDDREEVTDLFTLYAANGNSKSSEVLDPGYYGIEVEFGYNGLTIPEYVGISIGVSVECV